MDLSRGALAKIDRKVLSGLGHDESYQMARVPVSEATWSTWRRYCAALGLSMGRGIATLLEHELRTVVGEGRSGPDVFLTELRERVTAREAALDAREQELELGKQRLTAAVRRIGTERESSRRLERHRKVGRNEPCPCGSGVKYKRCHSI